MLKRPNIENMGIEDTLFWTVVAVTDITKQLTAQIKHLIVDSVAAASVYLPPVSLMRGKMITVRNKTGTYTVTVYPFAEGLTHGGTADSTIYDGAGSQTSQQLAASAGAFTTLYSDGDSWIALAFDLTI